MPDLVASIIDGRLFYQLSKLHSYQGQWQPLLLLEGTAASLRHSRFRREAIQGALIMSSLIMGIPVLRSLDPCESAYLLKLLGKYQPLPEQNHHESIRSPAPVRQTGSKYLAQLKLLQCLPGIGVKKAKALLKAFGTVEKVLLSSAEDLTRVEGIGDFTAEKIKWILR